MPKWLDRTHILRLARPDLTSAQMFWAMTGPEDQDLLAILSFNSETSTTLLTINTPDSIIEVEGRHSDLLAAQEAAERLLCSLGHKPPCDDIRTEWSN